MRVSSVKRRLRAHGFWPRYWPINEGYGPRTRDRVRAFQAFRGLVVDGVVGDKTRAALLSLPVGNEARRALVWASECIGVTEHPAGSNSGPRISKWTRQAGYGFPVPWCACFVGAAWQHATRGRVKASAITGYCPSIVMQARNGRNGLSIQTLATAMPGDAVMFNFGHNTYDHVGLFVRHLEDGWIETIEGNTSPEGSASGLAAQANGGGVFRRRRNVSVVSAVVRAPLK